MNEAPETEEVTEEERAGMESMSLQVPHPVPATMPTPMTLLAAAIQKGIDIEGLRALMQLYREHEANEARKAFADAMSEFKKIPISIVRNKRVTYANKSGGRTDYMHATLDEVCNKIITGLAAVGISHRWIPEQNGNRVKVSCVLTHRLGHSESITLEAFNDESGGKNAIQSIGSAVSYLQRYTVLAATGLAVGDDDDGEESGTRHAAPGEVYRVDPRQTVEGPTPRPTATAAEPTATAVTKPADSPKPVEAAAPAAPVMTDGQRRIIKAKLANAGISDEAFQEHFGKHLLHPTWLSADFRKVTEWIISSSK